MTERYRLPLQGQVDMTDPRARHQWVFVQWPFLNDQGYTPSTDGLEEWSERLDEIGYVHGPTLAALADENGMIHVSQIPEQKIKLLPPYRGQQHALNGTAAWVPMDTEEIEPVMIPDPAKFAVHEQAVMLERMRYSGVLKDPEPEEPEGGRMLKEQFDPRGRTPSAVNAYLEAHDSMGNEAEISRVLAMEMNASEGGKHRSQILDRWPGR